MKGLFNRVLIATDLSSIDLSLLKACNELINILGIKKIYLVHIMPDFNAPENENLNFHKLFSINYPIDEKVKDLLKNKVADTITAKDVEIAIDVIEGTPYKKLLHWIEVKDIDLVLVGKKAQSEGSGLTAKRIAHYTKCSVLFVPDKPMFTFRNIVVPIDFSNLSAYALEVAVQLRQKKATSFNLQVVYIARLLSTAYYYGLTVDDKYRASMLENINQSMDHFFTKHGFDKTSFEVHPIVNDFDNIAKQLMSFVQTHFTDLVIMGAQGHSAFETFLYGSVTEQFVEKQTGVPVLIIRNTK